MAIINLLEAEDFVVDPPTPGSFIKSLMDIKNSDWSAEEMAEEVDKHTKSVLDELQAANKLGEFLLSKTKNGFPVIFALAWNCEVKTIALALERAKVLSPDIFAQVLSIKYNDKTFLESMRDGRGEELLALLNNTVIKLPTKQKAGSGGMSYGQFVYFLMKPNEVLTQEYKRDHPEKTDEEVERYLADASYQDIKSMQESVIYRVLNEKAKDGSIVDFLSAKSKKGFPLIFSLAYGFDHHIVELALELAYAVDKSSLEKLTSLTYDGKTIEGYLKGKKTLDRVISDVKDRVISDVKDNPVAVTPNEDSKDKSEEPLSVKTDDSSEEEVTPVKSYGRGGKAAVLLDKNGATFKFLPPPAEVRRIEAGLSHNSIRLQDFQDFIIKQANRDELELPDKLSVSKGNKVLQKAVEQAKEILDVYKKGKNPTGLTPRELLFLKRLEKYCFVSPDGLLFSIKKYNWLRKQRNFKQIVMDLFK